VWSVALYEAETWTQARCTGNMVMEKDGQNCLDRPQNRHRCVRDSRRERINNDTIVRRKKNWIGHGMRGEGLLMEVMEGRIRGVPLE